MTMVVKKVDAIEQPAMSPGHGRLLNQVGMTIAVTM